MLGIDTASIDYGPSTDFLAHRVGAAANVANLENLTALDQLPPTGATVIALPMKIAGGSGGPVRVVALVPRQREKPDARSASRDGTRARQQASILEIHFRELEVAQPLDADDQLGPLRHLGGLLATRRRCGR